MGYLERAVIDLKGSQGYCVFKMGYLDVRERRDECLEEKDQDFDCQD